MTFFVSLILFITMQVVEGNNIMPAKYCICPSEEKVLISQCLLQSPQKQRCMVLPTLWAIAKSVNRNLNKPSITELLTGTREQYQKKVNGYAINPQDQVYTLHGSAIHTINEHHTQGNILSEEELFTDITSWQFDLYGEIFSHEDRTLGDLKITSSYKLMKALCIYKEDVLLMRFIKQVHVKGNLRHVKNFALTEFVIYLIGLFNLTVIVCY